MPPGRSAWTAVPAERSSRRSLRIKLAVIYVLLAVAASSGVFAAVAWSVAAPEPTDPLASQSSTRHIADAAVDDFLQGRTVSVPVSREASATFGLDEDAGRPGVAADAGLAVQRRDHRGFTRSVHPNPNVAGEIELHHYRVVSVDGDRYDLTVPVHVDGGSAALAAHPSLLPDVAVEQDPPLAGLDYRTVDGYRSNLGEAVAEVVEEWAQALLDDDGESLRRVAGDPREQVSYRGVSGFTLAEDLDEPVAVSGGAPYRDGVLARARIWVRGESAQRFVTSVDYDLYLTEVGTALPKVAAWGPPGSGPTLTPYANSSSPPDDDDN